MSIRWKLNLSVTALVAVFLAVAVLSLLAVRRHGDYLHAQSRMRTYSQQTSDIRAAIYQQLAAAEGATRLPPGLAEERWPHFVLEDIAVQIRLAELPSEHRLWSALREGILALSEAHALKLPAERFDPYVQRVERDLRHLRNYYDMRQSNLVASGARAGLFEYIALVLACALTISIFLIHVLVARDWLVKPIEVLRSAVKTIGDGHLDHRIDLSGSDELAELARGIESMADQIAERQAALVEARELSAVGELCGNVAHGLRNPLAAIRATAQLAARRFGDRTDAEELMRSVTDQADRMDQRISRLFEFSRAVRMEKSRVAFADVYEAALSRVQPLAKSRSVSSAVIDRTGHAFLLADRDQLVEVLAELISNAAHHSEPGARTTVRGEYLASENGTSPRIRIEVADQGCGMEASTLGKAFDPFFTSRPSGIGMGLALVRRIVERHDGKVSIDSMPDRGTTVTMDLPAVHGDSGADPRGEEGPVSRAACTGR